MTSSSVDGARNLNGKYRIPKSANNVLGLIMERLHRFDGLGIWPIFVSLAVSVNVGLNGKFTDSYKMKQIDHKVQEFWPKCLLKQKSS